MKILFLNDSAAPHGGAEIITLRMRDALRERGHDARLLASSAGGKGDDTCADYTCFGTTSSFRTLVQSANPAAFFALRRVLAAFKPDVVHVRMFLTQLSPLILPLLRRIPSLYHVVWYRPICPLGTKLLPDNTTCHSPPGVVCYRTGCLPLRDWPPLMFQMNLWRRWRNVFDLIVANSEALRRRLINEGIAPVEVVLNGVKETPGRPPLKTPPTAVFAGRLVREKGVDLLLRAFAMVTPKIPEARLIICGEGPERLRLEELVLELNLSACVSMRGLQPHQEVARMFGEAWAVAVPSRWEEPFGLVALEAMMAGAPVVASHSGGLAEIVRDGQTGFLVPPGDVDALAEALFRLLRDRQLSERFGQAGRELVLAEFSETRMVDRFVELYQLVLSSRVECARTNE